jgi:hypothetical protein
LKRARRRRSNDRHRPRIEDSSDEGSRDVPCGGPALQDRYSQVRFLSVRTNDDAYGFGARARCSGSAGSVPVGATPETVGTTIQWMYSAPARHGARFPECGCRGNERRHSCVVTGFRDSARIVEVSVCGGLMIP